jgi:hypothetical protein
MKLQTKFILALLAMTNFAALQAAKIKDRTELSKQGNTEGVKIQVPVQDKHVDINRIRFHQLPDGVVETFIPMQGKKHFRVLTYQNGQLADELVWDGHYEFLGGSADGSRLFLNEVKKNEKGFPVITTLVTENGKKLISHDFDVSNSECGPYYLTSFPNGSFLVVTHTDGTATIEKVEILGFNNLKQNIMLKSPRGSLGFMSVIVNDEANTLLATLEHGPIICFSLPEFERVWSINANQLPIPVVSLIPLHNDRVLGVQANNQFVIIDGKDGRIIEYENINEIRNRFKRANISLSTDMTASSGEIVLVETKNGKTTYFDLNGKKLKEYDQSTKYNKYKGKRVHFKRVGHSLRTFAIFADNVNLNIEEVK